MCRLLEPPLSTELVRCHNSQYGHWQHLNGLANVLLDSMATRMAPSSSS